MNYIMNKFLVHVLKIFKNAGRAFVIESLFSKVNFHILEL